jgi:hypothetical protein
MIKIESADGVCTITREGIDCVIFPGMIITPDEVETIVADGDVVYSIDEAIVVVVPKGTKATVTEVPKAEAPVEEAPVETPAEEAPTEAATQTEVVTETVETPAETAKKK